MPYHAGGNARDRRRIQRALRAEPKTESDSKPTVVIPPDGAPHQGWKTQPLNWSASRKLAFLLQLAGSLFYLYFAGGDPAPGWAIAVLGLMAAVMAFRAEAGELEKVCWLAVVFCLMLLEMVAISREHERQNATTKTIIGQGVQTLQGISALQNVKPQAPNTIIVSPPGPRSRSYVDVGPFELGINTLVNDPNRGRLFVNVRCLNDGLEVAELTDCDARVFIYEGSHKTFSKDTMLQEQYFNRFTKEQGRQDPARSLMPGAFVWFSPAGPIATPQLIEDLNNDKKLVVVVGWARYRDNKTPRETDLCEWLQPPVTAPNPVWHNCLIHEGEHLSVTKK